MIDVQACRADTPGTEHVLHFNNAGAGLMPRPVLEAVKEHLDLEAAIGGYEAADRARDRIERAYDAIARYLNCHRDEVAIVENATVAWNQAFFAVAATLKPRQRILTAEAEYASNYLTYLKLRAEEGLEVDVVPSDADGQLDVAALEAMIDDRVGLIAVTHVPTNGGLVNPAEAIGAVARRHGIPYLLDACQSAGQLPLDVERIGCDFLSVTGRKYLRGPRGTGFLYARKSAQQRFRPTVIDLHAAEWTGADRFEWRPDARIYENWENYEAGKIGLGVAVDYMLELGIDAIAERTAMLAATLRQRLAAVPGVSVHDLGKRKCGIVTFALDGHAPEEIKRLLAVRRINVTTTTIVSTRIDMERRGISDLVRASVHYYNTEAEIDRFVRAVAGIGGAS
ncbi:MAG: aminotransferase class V-fold PLP-dependent enzyme [Pseudomonadota bacterium]|nr:aminotransferase class V-fold PLP-dependent enzyme [Pseudomonadota bacterium]